MAAVKVGEYEKVQRLGGGGQGEVWKLRRKSDGKLFAGKFVARGQIPDDKIVREAAMLRTLDHPGLLKGYGIGLPSSPDEPISILMEFMDGPLDVAKPDGTLKSILLMFVARSLAYLHSKGIVHLDLKPANILMLAQRAKLGDFGSAKLFGLSVTQTSIALTQSYASPDALDGQDPDPLMDVYSFAVIAYELVTGKPAFDSKLPPMLLMNAIGSGRVPPVPSSVAPVLRQVIERGWALDPKQRPTMAAICETLTIARWCVFPGADAKKVVEAELEPMDAMASPATVALRSGELESEISALKGEVAVLQGANTQIPVLKTEIA
jgi:serine/threonine-protein kinase